MVTGIWLGRSKCGANFCVDVDQLPGSEEARIFNAVGRGDVLPIFRAAAAPVFGQTLHAGPLRRGNERGSSGGFAASGCLGLPIALLLVKGLDLLLRQSERKARAQGVSVRGEEFEGLIQRFQDADEGESAPTESNRRNRILLRVFADLFGSNEIC